MALHIGQMGAIGEIMALFGAGILWTFRAQAFEWLREFFDIWRGQISGRDPLLSDPLYNRARPRLALVFIGQVLFILDLTL